MERQLFENISQPEPGGINGKTELYFVSLSVVFHLVGIVILIVFINFDIGEPIHVGQEVVFSGMVYLENSKPPPPPLPLKLKPKHVIPSFPIEAPKGIKTEPIKKPEENLPDKTNDTSLDDNSGEKEGGVPEGIPGGVPRGIPGGIPGGIVGQPPSPGGSSGLPSGPIEIKGSIKSPKRIKYVHPDYPKIAILARVEGTVVIKAIIGKNGKIKSANIIESVSLLDDAALEAVKKWEYEPTVVDGESKEVILTVTIIFEIT